MRRDTASKALATFLVPLRVMIPNSIALLPPVMAAPAVEVFIISFICTIAYIKVVVKHIRR